MKKNEIIQNVLVEKLVLGGKGFAKLNAPNKEHDGKTIFITGGCIPGSIVDLRVLRVKKSFINTQIHAVIQPSPTEKKHPTNIYGLSGGWKWINIPYKEQLKIKQNQVEETFFHIKTLQRDIDFQSIEGSPLIDGYRNKIEFSFGKFISARYNREEHFNVGFHKQGEFSKIEDFEGCPLIDGLQNKIYKEIKDFSKNSGLPVYDSMRQNGFFRHIIIRKTYFTNQIMIIFGFNDSYKDDITSEVDMMKNFFCQLSKKYSEIKSVYLSYNSQKADIALGRLKLIEGQKYITERLHGLEFDISPRSFFQTNSSGAEKLYQMVLDYVDTDKHIKKNTKEIFDDMTVLDLYGGTGTIGMIFSKAGAKKVYSVEVVESASEDGANNAKKNGLSGIDFVCAKVEDFVKNYTKNKAQESIDILVIDPPRVGMHPDALVNVLEFNAKQIIYVSCNPATLVRDLEFILKNSRYRIQRVGVMDMFPHTHHIETIVSLSFE